MEELRETGVLDLLGVEEATDDDGDNDADVDNYCFTNVFSCP